MLESICESLSRSAGQWRTTADWPATSLQLCGDKGLFRGLSGLDDWTSAQQLATYIQLAQADLLTTFVITQHVGAIKRIVSSDRWQREQSDANSCLIGRVIPDLISGREIASVGISHLTTSRRHLGQPVVRVKAVTGGYRLNGTIPWVTGAPTVQQIVVGATLDDGSQLLVLVSPAMSEVIAGPGADMISLAASCTDSVELRDLFIATDDVLSGPRANVLAAAAGSSGTSTGAGGLQTSALALGLSCAAVEYLQQESTKRENLLPVVDSFDRECRELRQMILDAADGQVTFDSAAIRSQANRLVSRSTSAAMTTAKGAGLLADHPVGRWCTQALFFLVWSCPQEVAQSHLCEMAEME